MKIESKFFVCGLIVLLITSCMDVPKMPELNNSTKKTFDSVKNYLKCETISYERTKQTKNDTTKLYLDFLIYDLKRKNPNLDSINLVLMKKFEQNDFKLKDYYCISFFYFKDYDDAKLVRGFDYNGNGELIGVFYK